MKVDDSSSFTNVIIRLSTPSNAQTTGIYVLVIAHFAKTNGCLGQVSMYSKYIVKIIDTLQLDSYPFNSEGTLVVRMFTCDSRYQHCWVLRTVHLVWPISSGTQSTSMDSRRQSRWSSYDCRQWCAGRRASYRTPQSTKTKEHKHIILLWMHLLALNTGIGAIQGERTVFYVGP